MEVKFIPAEQLKEKPDENALGFGKYFTDYMFTMDWTKEKGWHNATIEPYGPVSLDPATMVLHYAQETFEGLKAYRTKEGKLLLFRPEMNAKRFANSNRRLCMEVLPEELFVDAIATLVSYEKTGSQRRKELLFTFARLCLQRNVRWEYTQAMHINL